MKTSKELFIEWLANRIPSSRFPKISFAVAEVERFAHKKGFFTGSLFDIDDPRITGGLLTAINADKIFRLTHVKLLKDIDDSVLYYHKYVIERGKTANEDASPAKEGGEYSPRGDEEFLPGKNSCGDSTYKEYISIVLEPEKQSGEDDYQEQVSKTEKNMNDDSSFPEVMAVKLTGEEVKILEARKRMMVNKDELKEKTQTIEKSQGLSDDITTAEKETTSETWNVQSKDQDELLTTLQTRNISYIDERTEGGDLWIVGGLSLRETVFSLREQGYCFFYFCNGSGCTGGKSAWCFDEKQSKKQMEKIEKEKQKRISETIVSASSKVASAPQIPDDIEYDWHREGLQIADWTKDDPYTYTQPEAYAYNGVTKLVNKWGTLYAEVCGLLFADYHDIFMTVMNGDIPGYNRLAFADEEHKDSIRHAKSIAPGYYLEANADATTMMRRIRGLVILCGVEDKLFVSYHSSKERISLPSHKGTVETDEGTFVLDSFKRFLLEKQGLAEKTAVNYCTYLRTVDEYTKQHELGFSLLDATADSIPGIIGTLMARQDFAESNTKSHHKYSATLGQYAIYLGGTPPMFKTMQENRVVQEKAIEVREQAPVDDRWQAILADSFPDGYILDDFLSQFQASAYWQERYDENCPIEGAAIDDAMKALGSVRDGRVYAKKEEDNLLISEICDEINSILSQYSTVYRSSIYERYRDQLAACSIYTEQVMTQQLKATAKGSFYSTYQVFARPRQEPSVMQDCRKVLRNHGGAMSASDVSKELWFIPYDTVYQSLVNDSEALNIGNSVWMLAEHFPLTKEDAGIIGDMLDECFLTQDFIQQSELMPLLQQHLPSIADNLSGLHFIAVFNILNYHLKNRFSFSKAIISPKGAKTDFRDLFRGFAREHERFTLDELSAFASELSVPIYWESTFDGGAVRLNNAEFINRKQIVFDVEATDEVLESFCTGDYLSIQALSPAMMVHLPPCGYSWNGFLLISYLYGFSKTFRLIYNSISKTGYYGAMVRRSCEKIDNYERLLERILTDDNTWSTEAEALSLLVKDGYQARLRLNGIGQIVEKARQNKLTDGM